MMAGFDVRPFEDADLPAVLDLLRDSLGESEVLKRTPELFAWKHLDSPFGRSIMFVAEDDEGIVGFRAFMRWELTRPEGDVLRSVRPVDTSTHPRARRRGVFRRLTEEAVEAARADGVHLIFNTPNRQSGPGYATMGWVRVGDIGVMVRPSRRILRRSNEFPTVEGASEWGDRDPVTREPLGLRTPRRVDYLKWRFGIHPTARYSVTQSADGSMAVHRSNLRNERGELVVSDLFGPNSSTAVRGAADHTDAAYLVGWAPTHSPERKALVRAGLVPVPGMKALTLFVRPLASLDLDVTNLSNWDLMLSDLELL